MKQIEIVTVLIIVSCLIAELPTTVLSLTTKDKLCNYPGSPAHSSVIFSDDHLKNGTIVTYYCERGFELLGPSRRICINGNWLPDGIPFCVINVAAGKAPMQSSTDGIGVPQKAIDGSSAAMFTPETCSLTKTERAPWWYVNLLEPYMVQLVRLDFGKSCCGNKPGTIVVRVGNNRPDLGTNPICNKFSGMLEEGQPIFLPCNPPMPGAFVSVHLEENSVHALSICEAFVYTDQALPIERCPLFRDQPPGASASYNGKCYTFYNRQQLNFEDALTFCKQRSGTLINESNPALQGFISWELWRRHRIDISSQYWMGAIRSFEDKSIWKWIDGKDVAVSFWSSSPDKENCARYDGLKGWLWSETTCNTTLNFICQHQPTACGRPEQPPNSTIIALDKFEVGTTVKYLCDPGHLLIGPTTRTCLKTGFYNEFPPVCKYIECGLPASIPHGSYNLINNSISYTSIVKYSCNEGYNLIGKAVLSCDIDERWNGPPPRCAVVECDSLPVNYYKTIIVVSNGTNYGSNAEISCANGYRLDGPNIITCLSNGQWSDTIPRCIKIKTEPTTEITIVLKPKTSVRPLPPLLNNSIKKDSTTEKVTDDEFTIHTPANLIPEHNPINDNQDNVVKINYKQNTPSTTSSTSTSSSTSISSTAATASTTTSRTTQKVSPLFVLPTIKTIKPKTNIDNNYIFSTHPQESNKNSENADIIINQKPNVNIPSSIDAKLHTGTIKLKLGAIIALGAFGGFVFLAAVITTIVILVRRSRTAHHYRHRASPHCNTIGSFDSSTSGSRNGLNRYYRQAWENLRESASKNSSHYPLRRDENHPNENSLQAHIHRSCDKMDRCGRDFSDDTLAIRNGGDLVISDVCIKEEKKRHHHHHHKSCNRNTPKTASPISMPGRDHRQNHHQDHHY